MRHLLIPLLLTACPALAQELVLEGDPISTTGTQAEILGRAASCVAQHVHNAGVTVSDSAAQGGILGGMAAGPLTPKGSTTMVTSGDVIVLNDPATGTLVANSRTPYRALMMGGTIQSSITIQSKDGRFRIRHSDIQFASKDTGSLQNRGFEPVHPKARLAKNVMPTLEALSKEISECITRGSDW